MSDLFKQLQATWREYNRVIKYSADAVWKKQRIKEIRDKIIGIKHSAEMDNDESSLSIQNNCVEQIIDLDMELHRIDAILEKRRTSFTHGFGAVVAGLTMAYTVLILAVFYISISDIPEDIQGVVSIILLLIALILTLCAIGISIIGEYDRKRCI